MQLATIDIFCAGEEWAKQRRPAVVETAGDLIMTSVLRSLDGKDLVERHPNLVAYKRNRAQCGRRARSKPET